MPRQHAAATPPSPSSIPSSHTTPKARFLVHTLGPLRAHAHILNRTSPQHRRPWTTSPIHLHTDTGTGAMALNQKDTPTGESPKVNSTAAPDIQGVPGTVRDSNSAGDSVFKNVVINGETYQYIEGCGLPPMLNLQLHQQRQRAVGSSSHSAGDAATLQNEDEHLEEEEYDDEGESDTFLDAQEHFDGDLYSDDGFGEDLPESVLTSTALWNALPPEDDYLDQLSDFNDEDIDSQTSYSKDFDEQNFDEALLESIADSEYLSDDAASDAQNKSLAIGSDFGVELHDGTHDGSIAANSNFGIELDGDDEYDRSLAADSDFDIELNDDEVYDRSMATISDFDCDDDQSVVELIEAAFADGELLEDTPADATSNYNQKEVIVIDATSNHNQKGVIIIDATSNHNQKGVIVIDADDNAPRPSSVVLGKRKADPEPLDLEKAVRLCLGAGSQHFPVELDSDEYDEEFDLQAFDEIHEIEPPYLNNTSGTESRQVVDIASSSGGSAATSSLSGSQGPALPVQQPQISQQSQKETLTGQNAAGSQLLSKDRSRVSLGQTPRSKDLPKKPDQRKRNKINRESTPSQSEDLLNESNGMIWGSASTSSEAAQGPSQEAPSGSTIDDSLEYSDEDPPPPYGPGVDEEDDPNRPQMTPPDPTKTADGLSLSPDQLFVLDQVVTHNKSVFFTGSAGTGKSVLLRELIIRLREKYSRWVPPEGEVHWDSDAAGKVAVTASTGIAACNIGGCTLHSFAGIGLGNEKVDVLIAKVRSAKKSMERWQKACVLIVDEVSMVDAVLLDKLEAIARTVRNRRGKPCRGPWGGMQVVFTGDFFQLPPVDKSGNAQFCFEAESWKSTIHATIELEQVFRQKDQTFVDMLYEARIGHMKMSTIERFQSLTRPLSQKDGLKPTELFPLRKQVEEANNAELRALTSESLFFEARDSGNQKDRMEQHCIAPTKLEIKVGAQVMLLRNQNGGEGGLVNGSIGVVVEYTRQTASNIPIGPNGRPAKSINDLNEKLPRVKFMLEGGIERSMVVGREEWSMELPDGEVVARRKQIPLCLAWSLSIHKAQGQTLPKVRVDLAKVFEKGQAYVALSRATCLEGLQVLNFIPQKVMVHHKVIAFYDNLRREKENERAPVAQRQEQ